MNRVLSIIGTALLWLMAIAFAVYFNGRAKEHYATTPITSMEIILTDSLQDEVLVKSSMVAKWISQSGIATIGTPIANVDLTGIEQAIRKNGFIEGVNAYASYDGRLRVEVSQRRPLLRLMMDGYNAYITDEGFIFPSPRGSAVYAPIVTGTYQPPVPAQYVGDIEEYVASLLAEADKRILEIQHEKVPLFERGQEIRDSLREARYLKISHRSLKKMRIRFQPSYQEVYDQDVENAKKRRTALRRKYRYWQRENNKAIESVTRRQDAEREKKKKLTKRYEDLLKLINFVKYIEEDAFWSAEIVQIVASTMSSGELRLDLIPRSGNHRIRFGTVDNVESKLNRLSAFYSNGLTNIGWDEFRTISVEYKGQVVCTK